MEKFLPRRRIVRVNSHTDLDEAFRRAMSRNEMNADEEE